MRKYNEVMEHTRVTEEMRERILQKIDEEDLTAHTAEKSAEAPSEENSTAAPSEEKQTVFSRDEKRQKKHPVSFRKYQKYMPAVAALAVLVMAAVLIPKVTMKSLDPAESSEHVQQSSENSMGGSFSQSSENSVEGTDSQSGGREVTEQNGRQTEQQEGVTESTELQGATAGYAGILEAENAAALSEELGFPVTDIRQLPYPADEVIYSNYFGDMAEIEYYGEADTLTYRKTRLTGEEAYDSDISGVYEVWSSEKQITVKNISVALKGNGDGWQIAAWTADGFAFALYDRQGLTEEEMTAMIKELTEMTGEKS